MGAAIGPVRWRTNSSLAAGAVVTFTYPISQDDGPLTVINTATVTSSQTSPVAESVDVQWQNVAPTASFANDGAVQEEHEVLGGTYNNITRGSVMTGAIRSASTAQAFRAHAFPGLPVRPLEREKQLWLPTVER